MQRISTYDGSQSPCALVLNLDPALPLSPVALLYLPEGIVAWHKLRVKSQGIWRSSFATQEDLVSRRVSPRSTDRASA